MYRMFNELKDAEAERERVGKETTMIYQAGASEYIVCSTVTDYLRNNGLRIA